MANLAPFLMYFQLEANALLREYYEDIQPTHRHRHFEPNLGGWHGLMDLPSQGVLEVGLGVKSRSSDCQTGHDVNNGQRGVHPLAVLLRGAVSQFGDYVRSRWFPAFQTRKSMSRTSSQSASRGSRALRR